MAAHNHQIKTTIQMKSGWNDAVSQEVSNIFTFIVYVAIYIFIFKCKMLERDRKDTGVLCSIDPTPKE